MKSRRAAGVMSDHASRAFFGAAATAIFRATTISVCRRENGRYCRHLSNVQRLFKPRKAKRMPQPVWSGPF